jgi:hypothetical protein
MTQKKNQLRVGSNGSIYVAPVGTTLPTTIAAVAALAGPTWTELGLATEDGLTLTWSASYTDIRAWQSFYVQRKLTTSKDFTCSVVLEQWNQQTLALALGATYGSAGVQKMYPNAPNVIDSRVLVATWTDTGNPDVGSAQTYTYALVVPNCAPTADSIAVAINRSDIARLPVTFTATPDGTNDPWYLLSNDPAMLNSNSS